MAIFTEFVTVPLITACPTCLSLSFFFFFQKKLIIYVLKFLSHSMKSQILNRYQRLGQCTVLCDTLLPVEVHCLFASTAVVSKTKWSAQEKTHSQELAMCWTVNCIFEPFDPLEGEVSLFFPFIYFSFRWNNQLPKHELLLFRVHETKLSEMSKSNWQWECFAFVWYLGASSVHLRTGAMRANLSSSWYFNLGSRTGPKRDTENSDSRIHC